MDDAGTHVGMPDSIRFLAIDAIVRAGAGHQGVLSSIAEIAPDSAPEARRG